MLRILIRRQRGEDKQRAGEDITRIMPSRRKIEDYGCKQRKMEI